MTYSEAIAYLESLIDYERAPAGAAAARLWNLDRMRHMLRASGNPHLRLRCLHIAGTKGKGSTAAMTASILTAMDRCAGLYTSPHLVSFRERIRVDGQMIPEENVTKLVQEFQPVIESMRGAQIGAPSFFEAYTLLAFLYFARRNVDVVVLEAGLGGRLDATNVVKPLVCAITRIGIDHTKELGETLAAIAREKAGIVKEGVRVISAPQKSEALEVLQEVCLERHAQLIMVGQEGGLSAISISANHHRQVMTIQGMSGTYPGVECPLLGQHQAENAAIAVGLVEMFSSQASDNLSTAIHNGLRSVTWPGRFHIISRRPYIILDGAHDETGAAALARTIEELFHGYRILLVLGIGRDKDAQSIAQILCPLADRVITTASASPRAISADELKQQIFRFCRQSAAYTPVSLALSEAISQAKPSDVILVTGSLYVVGEAMKALGVNVD